MIKPIVNEIFPSLGIVLKNKYLDSSRRAYFINKIYQSGVKNIEIGPLNKGQVYSSGIYENGYGHVISGNIKPSINQIIFYMHSNNLENMRLYGRSINESISLFHKYSTYSLDERISTKIVLLGNIGCDFPYIYNNTKPDMIEVSSINNIVLKTVDNANKISIRPISIEEVDRAYYECIYNYSSSLLPIIDTVETIPLIKHLQNKLGTELKVSNTGLLEVQKEMISSFNW